MIRFVIAVLAFLVAVACAPAAWEPVLNSADFVCAVAVVVFAIAAFRRPRAT